MGLDDGPAHRQPHAKPLPARMQEGREQPVADPVGNAGTAIGDPHLDQMPAPDRGMDRNLAPAGHVLHRLGGIADQVDDHLLDLDAVGNHARRLGRDRDPEIAAPGVDAGQRDARGIADHLGERLGLAIEPGQRRLLADPADDRVAARALVSASSSTAARPASGGPSLGEREPQPLHIIGDRGERLVELVGERRGHGADRAGPADVEQVRLQSLELAGRDSRSVSSRLRPTMRVEPSSLLASLPVQRIQRVSPFGWMTRKRVAKLSPLWAASSNACTVVSTSSGWSNVFHARLDPIVAARLPGRACPGCGGPAGPSRCRDHIPRAPRRRLPGRAMSALASATEACIDFSAVMSVLMPTIRSGAPETGSRVTIRPRSTCQRHAPLRS